MNQLPEPSDIATKTFKYLDGSKTFYRPVTTDLQYRVFDKVYTRYNNSELIFENDIEVFTFTHHQDCCEDVSIESIVGDLQDLVGTPILVAGERTSDASADVADCGTWTFYTFRTIKGSVDIRWLGQSNGYYSESVDLEYERKDKV